MWKASKGIALKSLISAEGFAAEKSCRGTSFLKHILKNHIALLTTKSGEKAIGDHQHIYDMMDLWICSPTFLWEQIHCSTVAVANLLSK